MRETTLIANLMSENDKLRQRIAELETGLITLDANGPVTAVLELEERDAEISRLRKIEAAALLALGLLWMIDHRGQKAHEAFRVLRDALGGPENIGDAIKAAIDAGYEADHPPSADWWAGKKNGYGDG